MPENRNDDAEQPASEPTGSAVPDHLASETPEESGAPASETPAADASTAGGAPTQPLYGQYGQTAPEQGSFAQPSGHGQGTEAQGTYGQVSGQDTYGQGSYGQAPQQPASGEPQAPYGQAPQQPASGEPQAPYGQAPQQPTYGQAQQQSPYGQQQSPYAQAPVYGQPQPPYGTPNYGYPGTYQPPAQKPGKVMGLVGLVLSCLFFIPFASLVGLILSIVGLVQSRKAKVSNGPALAGIIVGAVVFILTLAAMIMLFAFAADMTMSFMDVCAENGPGTHYIDGMTYECSPMDFEQSL